MKTGYKVLGMDMELFKRDGIVYHELNKDYHFDGEIDFFKGDGYYFFDSIKDCMTIHNLKDSRIFECTLEGDKFEQMNTVHCTNHIRLTREVSQDEIKKYIEDNLDELVNSECYGVREEVASYGYGLDVLV